MNLPTCTSQTQQSASSIVTLQSRLKSQSTPRVAKRGNVIYIQDAPWPVDFSVFQKGNRHNQQVHQLTRYLASVCQPEWSASDFIAVATKQSLRELQEVVTPRSKEEITRDAKSVALWCYEQHQLGKFRRPCWGEYTGECRKAGLTNPSMELSKRQSIGAEYGNRKRRTATLEKLRKLIQEYGLPKSKAQLAEWSGLHINTIYRHWNSLNCGTLPSALDMNSGERGGERTRQIVGQFTGQSILKREPTKETNTHLCEELRDDAKMSIFSEAVGDRRSPGDQDEVLVDTKPNVFEISVFAATRSKHSERLPLDWRQLGELLMWCASNIRPESKEEQSGMVLAVMDDDRKGRKKVNMKRDSNILALDFDEPRQSLEQVVERLTKKGLAAVGYHTFSSRSGQEKYRVIIPVNAPLGKREERIRWSKVVGRFLQEQPDLSCCDPTRLHYLPSNGVKVLQGQGEGALSVGQPASVKTEAVWYIQLAQNLVKKQRQHWADFRAERAQKKRSAERYLFEVIYGGDEERIREYRMAKRVGWDMIEIVREYEGVGELSFCA